MGTKATSKLVVRLRPGLCVLGLGGLMIARVWTTTVEMLHRDTVRVLMAASGRVSTDHRFGSPIVKEPAAPHPPNKIQPSIMKPSLNVGAVGFAM